MTAILVPGDRHHSIQVAPGATATLSFEWRDAPGIAPPADLWVESSGRTILQIGAIDAHPFARAGLDVVLLTANAPYQLVVQRAGESVRLRVLDERDGSVLVDVPARAAKSTEHADVDVVLPPASWRASIVSDAL
jgi:hypothetical protein